MLRVAGIDPGLDGSHASVIEHDAGMGACVYGVKAQLIGTPHGVAEVADALADLQVNLALVEVARGAVRGKLDQDPVLRNNIEAGVLMGLLMARGVPCAAVASGGSATPWNWPVALGVKGQRGRPLNAEGRDQLTCQIVRLRLLNPDAVPVGARGGHHQHHWDAAGVAFAGLDRLLAYPGLAPEAAMEAQGVLEQLHAGQRKTRKKINREARAVREKAGKA